MSTVTIAEVLRGTTPGRMQSVGYMQIIPLVSELVDDRFVTPDNLATSTSDYGTVNVHNESDGMTIMPFGSAVMTKQMAQNHAIPKAKLMGAKENARINTAACIQDSQGGTIRKGKHPMSIIPWVLKEAALMTRKVRSYQKLWEPIKEFNKRLGLQARGHLEYYMDRFKDDLDQFIAQFEVIPNQVGAILLLDGSVMGVERAPNYEYWKAVWKPLIRECYGSLCLQYVKERGGEVSLPKTRVPLKFKSTNSLDDISRALAEAKSKEDEVIKKIVRKFIKEKFKQEPEETKGTIAVENITHKQFTGQIVRDEDKVVYASLVTRAAWARNHTWYEADEFTI